MGFLEKLEDQIKRDAQFSTYPSKLMWQEGPGRTRRQTDPAGYSPPLDWHLEDTREGLPDETQRPSRPLCTSFSSRHLTTPGRRCDSHSGSPAPSPSGAASSPTYSYSSAGSAPLTTPPASPADYTLSVSLQDWDRVSAHKPGGGASETTNRVEGGTHHTSADHFVTAEPGPGTYASPTALRTPPQCATQPASPDASCTSSPTSIIMLLPVVTPLGAGGTVLGGTLASRGVASKTQQQQHQPPPPFNQAGHLRAVFDDPAFHNTTRVVARSPNISRPASPALSPEPSPEPTGELSPGKSGSGPSDRPLTRALPAVHNLITLEPPLPAFSHTFPPRSLSHGGSPPQTPPLARSPAAMPPPAPPPRLRIPGEELPRLRPARRTSGSLSPSSAVLLNPELWNPHHPPVCEPHAKLASSLLAPATYSTSAAAFGSASPGDHGPGVPHLTSPLHSPQQALLMQPGVVPGIAPKAILTAASAGAVSRYWPGRALGRSRSGGGGAERSGTAAAAAAVGPALAGAGPVIDDYPPHLLRSGQVLVRRNSWGGSPDVVAAAAAPAPATPEAAEKALRHAFVRDDAPSAAASAAFVAAMEQVTLGGAAAPAPEPGEEQPASAVGQSKAAASGDAEGDATDEDEELGPLVQHPTVVEADGSFLVRFSSATEGAPSFESSWSAFFKDVVLPPDSLIGAVCAMPNSMREALTERSVRSTPLHTLAAVAARATPPCDAGNGAASHDAAQSPSANPSALLRSADSDSASGTELLVVSEGAAPDEQPPCAAELSAASAPPPLKLAAVAHAHDVEGPGAAARRAGAASWQAVATSTDTWPPALQQSGSSPGVEASSAEASGLIKRGEGVQASGLGAMLGAMHSAFPIDWALPPAGAFLPHSPSA